MVYAKFDGLHPAILECPERDDLNNSFTESRDEWFEELSVKV